MDILYLRALDSSLYPEVAERVNAWWQYSSETNYIGSRPSVSMFFFFFFEYVLYSQTLY